MGEFQSTPPRGKRHQPLRRLAGLVGFNPRPRAGSDLQHHRPHRAVDRFQSTPPRGKRHVARTLRTLITKVSIHAPAREATRAAARPSSHGGVSIHAPAREATCMLIRAFVTNVSIHAPAREATLQGLGHEPPRLLFQSTPPRGKRLSWVAVSAPKSAMFQSTPPRGKRRDRRHRRCRDERDVSIHAPAREATGRRAPGRARPHCFNPRPRAGSDLKPPSSML